MKLPAERRPVPLLDVKGAADFLGVHPHHLYRLCLQKQIPHFNRPGVGIRFSVGALESWLAEGEVAVAPERDEDRRR